MGLALVSLLRTSQKDAASVGASIDYDMLQNSASLALRDTQSCTKSFQTAHVNPDTGVLSENGGAPLTIKIGDTVVAKAGLIIANRLKVMDVKVSQVPGSTSSPLGIQVGSPPSVQNVERYRMVVKISAHRVAGNETPLGGAGLHEISTFVWVDVDPGTHKVVQCGSTDLLPRTSGRFTVNDYIYHSSPSRGNATHAPWCTIPNPVTGDCSCPSTFLPYVSWGFSNPSCNDDNYCIGPLPDAKVQISGGGVTTYECLDPTLTSITPSDTHSGPFDFTNIPRCKTMTLDTSKYQADSGSYEAGVNPCCYNGEYNRAFVAKPATEGGVSFYYASNGLFAVPSGTGSPPMLQGTLWPRCKP
jgi:hypothetical protein